MAQFDSDGDEIPDFLRAFDDTKKTRQLIYDGMLDAVKKRFPVENDEYRIELSNVRYTGPKDYSLKQIKDALLKNRKLRTPMSGTWRLVHKPTNTVVDERDDVLMHVPYYTDRGTLISNGNEYTVVNQARLRSGVYARRKKSGEYEAQFNTKPGTGPGFHVEMAPSTGVFTLTSGQAHIPLYSVLRGLGVDDGAISRAWGSDITAANAKKHDPRAMRRLYARLAGRKAIQNLSDFETVDFVKNALSKTELDEDVVQRTMGLEGVKSVTPELLLRASQKILNISRGDEQEDKRDAPRFAQVYSIEDFLRERVDKDSGKLSQQLLWRAKRDRNLGRIPRGALNPYIDQFLNGTGLALPGEEASPLSNYVQMHRLTRLGQGGIGSIDLVTDEARDVQGDYLGFVDPVAGPESPSAGVDVRIAGNTYKGNDGQLYSKMLNMRTGKKEYVSLAKAADHRVAFPGQDPNAPYLYAMKDNVPTRVPRDEVDYMVPSLASMHTTATNLNPMPTGVQGARQFYATKFWEQYLPVVNGEVPLVDSLMPDGKETFSEHYGKRIASVTSQEDGIVTAVDDDKITVKGADGKKHDYELVKYFPHNRMSVSGTTRVFVKRGRSIFNIQIQDYVREDCDEVLSFDPATMKSAWQPVTGFTRHKCTRRMYRVKFQSGRFVDVTEDHSLLTVGDDLSIVPVYPKDCVCGLTKSPVVFGGGGVCASEGKWTRERGYIDGLYLSEGSISSWHSGICSIAVDPYDRNMWVRDLVKSFGCVPQKYRKTKTGSSVVFTCHEFYREWPADFGKYAQHKHIEPHVFSRGREYLEGLVAGYFGGDGCLWTDGNGACQLEVASTSERLILDIQAVLVLLGVFTTVRYDKFNGIRKNGEECFHLTKLRVLSTDVHKLKEWLCYRDRQAKLLSFLKDEYRASMYDQFPLLSAEAKHTLYACCPHAVPHFVYKTACKGYVSKLRLRGWSGKAKLHCESDFRWDRIDSVFEIPPCEYVYDFSVGNSEAFALSSGLLVHNSSYSTFPSVEVGQEVKKGDLLAHSNYTDKKTGAFNMGHNMKVAIMPSGDSSNYEDAITISETAAKKLATEQLFGFDVDTKNGVEVNKNRYMSLFPKKFTKDQYDTLDSNGVVKVGTVLHKGDPIIASVGPKLLSAKDAQLGKLSKVLRNSFTDRAEVWEHDWPGTVVDTAITPRGAKVNVVTTPPKQVGDKLCYDPETEVLTVDGWKRICDVSLQDSVATLNPDTGEFRYLHPDKVEAYRHVGDMYRIKSQQIDVLVTPNHRLYVQRRGKNSKFKLEEARDVFGKRVSYKKDGAWVGSEPRFFTFPGMFVGHRWGSVYRDELRMPIETFLMILGMYLSEGSCKKQEGHCYGISIAQKKRENIEEADRALRKAGLGGWSGFEWTLWGKQYYEYFKQFGNAQDKYIPPFVFGLSSRLQRILLKWLMWGDGYSKSGRYVCYTTCSKRLADDVQRLCLHCGYAANVKFSRTKGGMSHGWCVDHELISRFDVHDVRILTTKLTPTVNHSHVREQHTQEECYLKYDGNVYCCTMPKWGVIYVRRNGKAYWCGNSPTNALKGVIGEVRADSEMPRDAYTNEPYEVLMNPMGFLSRVAPNQLIEIALAKVAKKTGKQIRLPQLPPEEGWATWAQKQLDAAGVKDSADVFDPRTGKVVKNVGDGYVYMHAFHHLAEKKLSARGDDASYTQDEAPSRGGFSGAKRVSGLSRTALLSHGATENLKDMMTIRGTKNEEYWNKLRLGLPVQEPGVPFIYTKFLESLKAGGINVVEKGDKTSILPLTDKDIDAMSGGRIISSSKMMDADLRPVAGGLFDVGKTGGPDGNRWTAIKLPEPVPNPVMEEPVRRVLGLTVEKLENILAGLEKLDGKTGGEAIKSALEKVDVEQRIKQARQDIVNKRGAARDDAVKVLGYLKSMQEQGLEPKDWMISKVPVIPPKFRPVSKLGDVQLVADLNELYKDVIENAENYSALKGSVADSSLADERLNLYKSVAAAFGLGDPITPEGQAKNIKGAVRQVIGTGSPKFSMFQSKIIAKNLDNVGRGVVIPDENLDMDQIGIPKNIAWEVYKPYVQRSLVRRGYNPVQATRMIDERDRTAESFLREEMDRRPVLMERAPAWHKFNVMAFRPTLVDGNTIRVSPLVDEPYTMDHDGDQVNIHVPSSSKAVKEAYDRMLPSKNLTSLTDLSSPRYKLAKEQVLGLYNATQPALNKKPVAFRTVQEAKEAYRKGLIGLNDPIRILT